MPTKLFMHITSYLLIAMTLSVAQFVYSQDFSQEAIKNYTLQSQMLADLYVSRKVLQKGTIKWLKFRLTEFQIASLKSEDLRLLRNAIYANNGYIFKDDDIKNISQILLV